MARTNVKNEKEKTLHGLLLKLGLAVVAVYLVFSFVNGQMKVAQKQQELHEITARLEVQAGENREMERLMEADEEQTYIERMAREKLGYARPQERVFVDLAGE